jgi:hypothetical protein
MGTPCVHLMDPVVNVRSSTTRDPLLVILHSILQYISPTRRLTRERSCEVGILIHRATKGTDWALREWIEWVLHECDDRDDIQTNTELAEEWSHFSYGDLEPDPLASLYDMVRRDNEIETTARFIKEMRALNHQERGVSSEVMFGIMGSARQTVSSRCETVWLQSLRPRTISVARNVFGCRVYECNWTGLVVFVHTRHASMGYGSGRGNSDVPSDQDTGGGDQHVA